MKNQILRPTSLVKSFKKELNTMRANTPQGVDKTRDMIAKVNLYSFTQSGMDAFACIIIIILLLLNLNLQY